MKWWDRAECKGLTHLFYARESDSREAATRRRTAALAVCAMCPVLAECREWAMTTYPDPCPGGVLGGMADGNRRRSRYAYQSPVPSVEPRVMSPSA